MLVRFRHRQQRRLSLAPAGRAPELLSGGFLHLVDFGRGCFQLPPAGAFDSVGRFASNRASGHSPWRQRRILTSDKSTVHALAHMSNTPLHDPPEAIDTDLPLRGNRKSRLLTAGIALGDEIFVGSCSERDNEEDKTQSKGRSFHDRPFRRKYQEIDSPISPARRFGPATNLYVYLKKRCRFQPRNTDLMPAD
jgi:hypothetical protein